VAKTISVSSSDGGGPLAVVGPATVPPATAMDLGAAPMTSRLRLDLVLKPRDPAALTAFATAVSAPESPLFRHYLAKGKAAKRFGAARAAVTAVRDALARHGLHVGNLADGLVLSAAGTVGQVERTFHASMHAFLLASGAVADANVTSPRLPAGLAREVLAVVGLDDLYRLGPAPLTAKRARNHPLTPDGIPGQAEPCAQATASGGWTGPQIAQAYDLDPLYNIGDFGSGETVDLVELAQYSSSVIAAYQTCYGTSVPVHTITVDPGLSSNPNKEDEVDIEDLVSLAPELTGINVYETPATATDMLDLLTAILHADNARIVSDS
jgi:subtilase family serine protease